MTGLDTNVLLAWLLDGQARALTGGPRYRVSHVVLAEIAWVLATTFKRPRNQIAAVISGLADAADVVIDREAVVRAALADYRAGSADFADHLIARENEAAGCDTTLTLDRKAARHPAFTLLGR